MSKLSEITETNFEAEITKSSLPVLVDFWAVWCGPCKMIAPIVEQLSTEYAGKMKFGQCDVDKNQQIAIKYGIRSIPTLLVFKNGEVAQQMIGALPKQTIKAKIDDVLRS
jgi:thioredoxin 1